MSEKRGCPLDVSARGGRNVVWGTFPGSLPRRATRTVFSRFGTQTFTEAAPKGNGESFFTLLANAGTTISSVTLNSTGGFGDLRQPRISGAARTPAALPEPSQTAPMGLGLLGLAGLVLVARKRQARQNG